MALNNKLQTILLKAKENVYSHLSGGNLSQVLGKGYDFAELREYDSSDDARHISWINSAKLGRPYIKKMHEERELNVAVCSILNGRFLVGQKQELLTYIVAILAYSTYESNDLFSGLTLIGSEFKQYEATKNIYVIENYLESIGSVKLLGKKGAYEKLFGIELASKHLLFIVGDFLDEVDLSILAQKHEVVVIIVRDTLEENPKASMDKQLVNPQTNHAITQTLNKKSIEHYRVKLLEHDKKLYAHLHRHNIRFVKVYEKRGVIESLNQLFRV